jgi:hypothetical protein
MKKNIFIFSLIIGILFPVSANAVEDYSCMNFKIVNEEGLWSLSEGPEVTKAVVTWSIIDPGNCITKGPIGLDTYAIYWVGAVSSTSGFWDGTWTSSRDGQNYVIIFEFDIPNSWLSALGNSPGTYSYGMPTSSQIGYASLSISELIERKVSTSQRKSELISGVTTSSELWAQVLSNRQKLTRNDCIPEKSSDAYYFSPTTRTNVKILSYGDKPRISVEITESSNCTFLIHTPPIGNFSSDNLINFPFWDKKGEQFWSNLISTTPSLIRISATEFGKSKKPDFNGRFTFEKDATPINTIDSISIVDNKIVITSELDLTSVNKAFFTSSSYAQIVIGAYSRFDAVSSCFSGGWNVNWTSKSSFSVRYSKGGCTPSGLRNSYQVISTKIQLLDLVESDGVAKAEAKANTELKAKQEAEAKAATELKAKQEAEAKAATELKAKQEADAKATVIAELKAKQQADSEKCLKLAETSGTLKSQIEAYKDKFPGVSEFSRLISAIPPNLNCNEAFQSSAFEGQLTRLETSLVFIDNEFTTAVKRATSSAKITTITCTKGKLTKKITAVKPVCPKGYKKK